MVKAKRSKLVYLHTKSIIELILLLLPLLPRFVSVRVKMWEVQYLIQYRR